MTASNVLFSIMAIRHYTSLVKVVFRKIAFLEDVDQVKNPSHAQMFEDDILIDVSSNTVDALTRPLSLSVTSLELCLEEKGLIVNPGKTQVIGFHSPCRSPLQLTVNYNGTALVQKATAKYLGLW